MTTPPVVIVEVRAKQAFQVTIIEYDDPLEQLSANTAYPSLRICVLPRSSISQHRFRAFGAPRQFEANPKLDWPATFA